MTTTSTFSSRLTLNKQSSQQNLFQKIEALEVILQGVQSDLFKLDQQAKSIQQQKSNVETYLQERAENTRNRLMGELKKFEAEVHQKIDTAKKQTTKLDQKINLIKQGQLATLQMVLSLQRRVRQIEVQLGCAD